MSNEQQNARNAEFEDKPLDSASMCPLNIEAAIFPVRYAIDESADKQGSDTQAADGTANEEKAQGPHPLPETWQGASHPALNTRSYCLRQLRDGWLYVWDETDETFHEYRIEGHQFTRIPWSGDVGTQQPDERTGGGETRPYLLYPCRSQIWLAYSCVQWTWRICEHMRSNASARTRFMRPLSIRSAVEAPESTSHVGPLSELGTHVADITPGGAVRDFESTTVMTRELEQEEAEGEGQATEYPDLAHKPEIAQAAVLGAVPDQDEAFFVALDDDLGMVNDLTMQLLGIEAAYEMFEDEYGHRLKTALMVQRLCGISESELPEGVPDDPEQQRQAIEALGDYYELKREQRNRGARPGPNPIPGQLEAREAKLRDLGIDPETDTDAEAWQSKLWWRNDVRYDEALAFIQARQPELERLERQREQCRADLIIWLDRLPLSAQELCFDGC
ncbi:T6SS effector BTH_I2691 family protein, partial [Halomonas halmophila]|uniref:T6SS effector BTH_I2691 family protein n=1 Tax=Halomonas halmophila TaxID=252 RepID=UPI00248244EC